jgi:hypothetical protein
MPMKSEICRPVRYSGTVSAKSLMINGDTSAKMTPSMPSNPQPRPLAVATCQCVGVMRLSSATAR